MGLYQGGGKVEEGGVIFSMPLYVVMTCRGYGSEKFRYGFVWESGFLFGPIFPVEK